MQQLKKEYKELDEYDHIQKRKGTSIMNTMDAFAKSAPLLGVLFTILCIPFYFIRKAVKRSKIKLN